MQQIIMDEIMKSVCTLAQDQYGNYVIQVCKIRVDVIHDMYYLLARSNFVFF